MDQIEEDARKEGGELKLISQVCRKLKKGKKPYEIAEDLDEDIVIINKICKAAESVTPEFNEAKIYEALHETDYRMVTE